MGAEGCARDSCTICLRRKPKNFFRFWKVKICLFIVLLIAQQAFRPLLGVVLLGSPYSQADNSGG